MALYIGKNCDCFGRFGTSGRWHLVAESELLRRREQLGHSSSWRFLTSSRLLSNPLPLLPTHSRLHPHKSTHIIFFVPWGKVFPDPRAWASSSSLRRFCLGVWPMTRNATNTKLNPHPIFYSKINSRWTDTKMKNWSHKILEENMHGFLKISMSLWSIFSYI